MIKLHSPEGSAFLLNTRFVVCFSEATFQRGSLMGPDGPVMTDGSLVHLENDSQYCLETIDQIEELLEHE